MLGNLGGVYAESWAKTRKTGVQAWQVGKKMCNTWELGGFMITPRKLMFTWGI